jgi:NCS2 family nucleobase:cation symporter-2
MNTETKEISNQFRGTTKEDLSIVQTALLGLEHVLVMNVFVIPVLVATALSMSDAAATQLIQSTFLGAGLATLVQVLFFHQLPVVNGASFVPIGALIGIYHGTRSMDVVMGASLIGALFILLLGFSGIYKKITKNFIPTLVSGVVIMIIGLSLLPSAFESNIYVETTSLNIQQNILLASLTAGVLIFTSLIGHYVKSLGNVFQYTSVIIALAVGTLIAHFIGGVNWQTVTEAPWISFPRFAFIDYGFRFDLSAIITMMIIYLVILTEATSTWYAISSVSKEELTDDRMNRGVIGEGITNVIGALVGATPSASYSSSAGIISITGVASRQIFIASGIWLFVLAFAGKLSAIIHAIPSAVIGGVFAIVCIQIFLAGFKVVKEELNTERATYIVGIPLIVTVGLILLPEEVIETAPQIVQYFLNSPIAISAIVAILLNQLIPTPNKRKARDSPYIFL